MVQKVHIFFLTIILSVIVLLAEFYWLNSNNKNKFIQKFLGNFAFKTDFDVTIDLGFLRNFNDDMNITEQNIKDEPIRHTIYLKTTVIPTLVNSEPEQNNFKRKNIISTTVQTLLENIKDNSSNVNKQYKPSIFCFILTTTKSLDTRTKLIRDSWAKLCDNHRFITTFPKSKNNYTEIIYNRLKLLQPPGYLEDKYSLLTDKVYLTIKYIYEKYNNYDWYLKADDDTFIFINNLRNFLADKNSSQPVTYGYDFKVIVDSGYHSGGAGYVLSKEAMLRLGKKLSENYKFCPNTGTEDVDVAKCLRLLKVYPNSSIDNSQRERFHPLDIEYHYQGGFPDWMYAYAANPVKNVRYNHSIYYCI